MAITISTRRADIFKEFLAVIRDNIVTSGVKTTNAFVDDNTVIPQIVIEVPKSPRERQGFSQNGITDYSGTIEIQLIAATTKDVSLLADDVENAIFSNLDQLSIYNLRLGEGTVASVEVGGTNARTLALPLSFMLKR